MSGRVCDLKKAASAAFFAPAPGLTVLPQGQHVARMQAVWAFLKETVAGEAKQLVPDGKENVSRT